MRENQSLETSEHEKGTVGVNDAPKAAAFEAKANDKTCPLVARDSAPFATINACVPRNCAVRTTNSKALIVTSRRRFLDGKRVPELDQ